EVVFRARGGQVVEGGFHHGRSELFRRKTVATAHNLWQHLELTPAVDEAFAQGRHTILEERLGARTGFFRPVKDRDGFNRGRERFYETLAVEGTVQTDLDHADLLTASEQVIDRLVRRFAAGTHQHDHTLGLR